jgi:lysophospholipase L1-like esterase
MRKVMKKSRKAIKRSMVHLAIAAVSVGGAGFAKAQTKPTTPTVSSARTWAEASREERFQDSVDAFVAADREHAPKQGGIVFVGSSTIRMWDTLEAQFDKLPVVRRGFGGSRMSDCTFYLGKLVTPHKPRMVVVYAGDNDLNEGAKPHDVLKSFADFVAGVRKQLPDVRIAYVSIKPSPSRATIMNASRETNSLIEKFSHTVPNLDYIDTFSAMLDAEGKPRHELFRADDLHMNAKGYALWRSIIAPHVMKMNAPRTMQVKEVTVERRSAAQVPS